VKKSILIFALLALTACDRRHPARLTDLGAATFTATRYGSESYRQVRPRRHTMITIHKTRYYVVMETADGKYSYRKPAATVQKAQEQVWAGRRRPPVSVERQVFEDPATGELYFFEKGLTERQAIEVLKNND
jgi:hypothetical protein